MNAEMLTKSVQFCLYFNAIIPVSIKYQISCWLNCRLKNFRCTKTKWIHKILNLCIFLPMNMVQCCTSVYNGNMNCSISFLYFNLKFVFQHCFIIWESFLFCNCNYRLSNSWQLKEKKSSSEIWPTYKSVHVKGRVSLTFSKNVE